MNHSSVSRVTFESGQYVTGNASTTFDAVALAISGGGTVLRSRKVLLVEMVDHADQLIPFSELCSFVEQRFERLVCAVPTLSAPEIESQVQKEIAWKPLMGVYAERVRLPKYNIQPSVMSATDERDGAKILREVLPGLTRGEHKALAAVHEDMAKHCQQSWDALLDVASLETFGRPFGSCDYRISGIARDEYPDVRKEQLRTLAQGASRHKRAARAHAYLATGRLLHH
ncbi:TPA: hypothetical protein ACYLN4_001096 [Burkholderia lata]